MLRTISKNLAFILYWSSTYINQLVCVHSLKLDSVKKVKVQVTQRTIIYMMVYKYYRNDYNNS